MQRSWNKDDVMEIIEGWEMKNVYSAEKLKATAFIQNNRTHEVYQAAVDARGVFSDVSSTDNEGNREINIYPNPADNFITILFNKETEYEISLKLFNNIGELVYSENIPEGTLIKNLQINKFPNGLYLLNLNTVNKPVLKNFKLIVGK
jgi:hypothetical protein